jgi:penicillin-binding protein A
MALVGAAIANDGVEMQPRLVTEARDPSGRVIAEFQPKEFSRPLSPENAAALTQMMVGVVASGTGTSAQIPGVTVAGKTGTAELETTKKCEPPPPPAPGETVPPAETCVDSSTRTDDTDAWFTAFAPARHPRIVVCVMLVRNGAGGDTAAPAARGVLIAGLK